MGIARRAGKGVIVSGWRSRGVLRAALTVSLLVSLMAALVFANRLWRGADVMHAAVALEEPTLGELRAWMSVRYVADKTGVKPEDAGRDLGLSADDLELPIRVLADRRGVDRLVLLRGVQSVLAARLSRAPPPVVDSTDHDTEEWLAGWILAYGYPLLAVTLALGAAGAPLPSGLSLIVMGSLASQGTLDPWVSGIVATLASVLGDLLGYALGARFGEPLLARHGRWLGLTSDRLSRARAVLSRWGIAAVVLSRSLISFLSSAVNLVAGMLRQPLPLFVVAALFGRAVWSAGYIGLGMAAAAGVTLGAALMRDLSGLLIALLAAGFSAAHLRRLSVRRVRTG